MQYTYGACYVMHVYTDSGYLYECRDYFGCDAVKLLDVYEIKRAMQAQNNAQIRLIILDSISSIPFCGCSCLGNTKTKIFTALPQLQKLPAVGKCVLGLKWRAKIQISLSFRKVQN